MNDIIEIITSIGFPMAACIVIYMDSRKDKEKLYTVLDKFGDKLDNFDITLKGIDQRLSDLEERRE